MESQYVFEQFHESMFKDSVESFILTHFEDFAVVHRDGSCPMHWVNIHRKFKALYEKRLLQVLDDCDAEVTAFMDYFTACSDVYGDDEGFRALLAALTASEDFHAFQQIMFTAVRENWQPDEHQKAPMAGFQFHEVRVNIPEGAEAGSSFTVTYLGEEHRIIVPEGQTGDITVTLQVPEAIPVLRPRAPRAPVAPPPPPP